MGLQQAPVREIDLADDIYWLEQFTDMSRCTGIQLVNLTHVEDVASMMAKVCTIKKFLE